MRADLKLHLIGGLAILAWAAVVVWAYLQWGAGPAAAAATTLGGLGVEGYQWIRTEGEPDPIDAAVTAFPGWLAWVVLAVTPT